MSVYFKVSENKNPIDSDQIYEEYFFIHKQAVGKLALNFRLPKVKLIGF